jgi:hypothetical protein
MFEDYFAPAGSAFAITLYVVLLILLILCALFIILFSVKAKQLTNEKSTTSTLKEEVVTLEGKAKEIPQLKNDLTLCQDGRKTCDESLNKCSSDTNECNSKLTSCNSGMVTCGSDKAKCLTNLTTCQKSSGDTSKISASLNTCNSQLSACSSKLNPTIPISLAPTDLTASGMYDAKKYPLSNMLDRNIKSWTHLPNTGNQWILVTLKKTVPITKVVIETARVSYAAGRLNNVVVDILDEKQKVVFTYKIIKETPTIVIMPTTGVKGKYVKLTKSDKDHLTVSEITIFTNPDGAVSYSAY